MRKFFGRGFLKLSLNNYNITNDKDLGKMGL